MVLGLRGPGRFLGGAAFDGMLDDAAPVGVVESGVAGEDLLGRGLGSLESSSFHNGHFWASGESSGTSTTSLKEINSGIYI